jgi:hypothetical protein
MLMVAPPTVHAQYYPGYGGYGWGGWGGGDTVQGSIARGLGYYNIGAGIYNQQTAVANSINADTIMRWNQYWYLSQQEANRREYYIMAERQAKIKQTGDQIYQRLRDNPNAGDIARGDALNVVLDQVTDPRIHSSALRMAKDPITAEVVGDIPFENASEAVSISLNQLGANDVWPSLLRGENFAPEREAYKQAVAQALQEDENDDGIISPETIANVRTAVARIRTKLTTNPPAEKGPAYVEAINYVKGLTGIARMLESPNVDKVLAELKKVQKTTLGSLLGFMHTYNLRFGPATTQRQRAVYNDLYPMLTGYRDRVLKSLNPDTSQPVATAAKGGPSDFFQNMHLEHLAPPPPPEAKPDAK